VIEHKTKKFRDITVVAARRSFIPPTMLEKRDFVVIHTSAYKDFGQNGSYFLFFIFHRAANHACYKSENVLI